MIFLSDNGAEGTIVEAMPLRGLEIEAFVAKHCDNSVDNLGGPTSNAWYGPRWAGRDRAFAAAQGFHHRGRHPGGELCPHQPGFTRRERSAQRSSTVSRHPANRAGPAASSFPPYRGQEDQTDARLTGRWCPTYVRDRAGRFAVPIPAPGRVVRPAIAYSAAR